VLLVYIAKNRHLVSQPWYIVVVVLLEYNGVIQRWLSVGNDKTPQEKLSYHSPQRLRSPGVYIQSKLK
jgi:hypothetical protein